MTTRSLLAALLAAAAAFAAASEPIVLPFEVIDTLPAIRVKVGGVERLVVLTTESPTSYLKGAPEGAVDVEAGGRVIARGHLAEAEATQVAHGEEGGLGMDLLRGMAVGLDENSRKVTIWAKGALPKADAEGWISALPAWGGPSKVRRIALGRLPTDSPSIETRIAGRRVPALLRLGYNDTFLPISAKRGGVSIVNGFSLVSGVSTAGLPPAWLLYAEMDEADFQKEIFGVDAWVSQSAFGSRRVLIDFPDDVAWVEDLPEDARLSGLVSKFTGASLQVRGNDLVLQLPP